MGDRRRCTPATGRRRLLAAGVVMVALLAGCGGEEEQAGAPPRVAEQSVVKKDRWTYARARFNEMCAGCHSLADAGARGRRFNLDHVPTLSEDLIRHSIRNGEPGMPAWGGILSKQEFAELVAYVDAVAKRVEGEDDWKWQRRLRAEGEEWEPEDSR